MRISSSLLLSSAVALTAARNVRAFAQEGPGAIKAYLLEQSQRADMSDYVLEESPNGQHPLIQFDEFPARYFRQPLDHFSALDHSFNQRYWVSKRHYKEGGPVFVLDGGETSGEDRLPFLDTGILDIFARETGGLGIVLEHRYYGTSIPVANFSTDSMRWLDNAQSAADSANFMSNVKIEGLNETIASPNRPWIYYGGSYAGARAAHMRVLYPSIVYGAIASSAVTHATVQYAEYLDLIRNYTPPACRNALQHSIGTVDYFLSKDLTRGWVKGLFGLRGLKQDEDFAYMLRRPLSGWQAQNWDPSVGSTTFDEFCDSLVGRKPHRWGEADIKLLDMTDLQAFSDDASDDLIAVAEISGNQSVHFALFNFARYIRKNFVSKCPHEKTVEDCFGTSDPAHFQDTSLSSTWRAWQFQVCTEWGYFQTAPPDPDQPTIVSRLLDLEYTSRSCKLAFPPGEHFIVPSWPNVTVVNALGDFDIAADRLAFIDGEIDPWRPASPHSDYAKSRNDTILRPFKLIPGGVHHWDENGHRDPKQEPEEIRKIHLEEIEFVKAWLTEWRG